MRSYARPLSRVTSLAWLFAACLLLAVGVPSHAQAQRIWERRLRQEVLELAEQADYADGWEYEFRSGEWSYEPAWGLEIEFDPDEGYEDTFDEWEHEDEARARYREQEVSEELREALRSPIGNWHYSELAGVWEYTYPGGEIEYDPGFARPVDDFFAPPTRTPLRDDPFVYDDYQEDPLVPDRYLERRFGADDDVSFVDPPFDDGSGMSPGTWGPGEFGEWDPDAFSNEEFGGELPQTEDDPFDYYPPYYYYDPRTWYDYYGPYDFYDSF